MSMRKPSWVLLAGSLVLGMLGCHGPPKPKKAPKPQTEPGESGAPEAVAEPEPTPDAPSGEDEGVSDPAAADPLGSRFKDPSWYSPDIIAHEKIIQNGRSEAREDGTFSNGLVLQLAPNITAEECLQTLVGKAEADGFSFGEPEKGADGRLTARSENERMRVTFVCGVAKGTPTAFVGYEWKSGA